MSIRMRNPSFDIENLSIRSSLDLLCYRFLSFPFDTRLDRRSAEVCLTRMQEWYACGKEFQYTDARKVQDVVQEGRNHSARAKRRK